MPPHMKISSFSHVVVGPHDLIQTIPNSFSRLKVTMIGAHEVRYFAMDEQGNISLLIHKIAVNE